MSGTPGGTPLVRKLAAMHGVDLTTLEGTGVGGRIRPTDVLAAAGVSGRRPRGGDARASTTPASVASDPAASRPDGVSTADIVYARWPAPASSPAAPKLFSTGDLPPFTASGLSPSVLASLPPGLRMSAAMIADPAGVLRMVEQAAAAAETGIVSTEGRAEGDFAWINKVWPTA